MNLQQQIELINNPQDFTRLYNSVLTAEYGDDYLAISDDRADRGNDGYLKSEKRLFAGHCFKRVQNQGIEKDIRNKLLGDLNKAINLKTDGSWQVKSWTFLSNYPIPESIAQEAVKVGAANGIDVGWRGPEYFADILQKYKNVRAQFPNLQGNEIMNQLEAIIHKLEMPTDPEDSEPLNVPRNSKQLSRLLAEKPEGWEYLLFAGILFLGKESLEFKWHDHEIHYARRTGRHLDDKSAFTYMTNAWSDLSAVTSNITSVLTKDFQKKAFGAPGIAGDARRIEHIANHVVNSYEELLDWAADIRGTSVSSKLKKLYELAALVTDKPAQDIRDFIDEVVTQTSKIPGHLATTNPSPLRIELTLTLTVENDAISAFNKELRRVRRRMR